MKSLFKKIPSGLILLSSQLEVTSILKNFFLIMLPLKKNKFTTMWYGGMLCMCTWKYSLILFILKLNKNCVIF